MRDAPAFIDDLLPAHDDPVIMHEPTDYGWRGLTQKGELLQVRSRNGHKAIAPESGLLISNGKLSRMAIGDSALQLADYLEHFESAMQLFRANRTSEALAKADVAVAIAPTLFARFNRSMILLSLGRWREGMAQYRCCEAEAALMRKRVRAALDAGLAPWNGEALAGKRLLLIHAHGFGDTIMLLRYVAKLRAAGVDVVLQMPPELQQLASQLAPVTSELVDADFFCPMLHLIEPLQLEPKDISGAPYLRSEPMPFVRINYRERIGIAWASGIQSDGDYPRSIPLAQLVEALGDAELHSMQLQGADEARALDVRIHSFRDFDNCARWMLTMDRIVSVDTAALHLAGAIGHPRIDALLSHWHSWRWLAPWYENVRFHCQKRAGDWASALNQMDA